SADPRNTTGRFPTRRRAAGARARDRRPPRAVRTDRSLPGAEIRPRARVGRWASESILTVPVRCCRVGPVGVQYDLGGRRILVIGGSSGVGREVGLAASRAGARVAFAARRRDLLDQAAEEARNGPLPRQATPHPPHAP